MTAMRRARGPRAGAPSTAARMFRKLFSTGSGRRIHRDQQCSFRDLQAWRLHNRSGRSASATGEAISSDSRRTSAASRRNISQSDRSAAGPLASIRAQARPPALDRPPKRRIKPRQRSSPAPAGGVLGSAEAETPDRDSGSAECSAKRIEQATRPWAIQNLLRQDAPPSRACYSADGRALRFLSDKKRQNQVPGAIRFGGADPPSSFPTRRMRSFIRPIRPSRRTSNLGSACSGGSSAR